VDNKERALVDRALSGDQEACTRLVNDYSRMVGTVIWRATGDNHVVEDLAQETFLRVFKALGYFDSRGKLSTWIYTIAHRVAIDHLRKVGRWREESIIDESKSNMVDRISAPESFNPEGVLVREEICRVVREELERLPDTYRLALVYTAIEGLDYPTVAGMLGIPVGTLKTYVFRGKRMLKEKISDAM